jgi:N utilization substance protein B
MLFQLDLGSVALPDIEQSFLPGASAPEAAKLLALQMTKQVWGRVADLDNRLRGLAEHWDMARMAAVDRNVLRMGAYEILFDPQVPKSVAINEAIEIAKRFSTDASGKFVNGILDRLEKPAV